MTRKRPPIAMPAIEYEERMLDEDMVAEALAAAKGNISAAADMLEVRSDRLRRYIASKTHLKERQDEVIERGVDKAIDVLFDGLDNPSYLVKLAAAKEFLKTGAAGRRGFRANAQTIELQAKAASGQPISIRWVDPDPGIVIEGEKS